ncbi:hypothetical protein SAMN06295974_1995 [Plantibacter flavus]|uniref:Bacterial Pleckstrin homology domain-containing protein n=1 Tax=Plantibacter flavus TaxID=150123 RepID=A0A3N2BXX1_9MICO|nr:hypothetical protein [Plantibacter flavus]ROR80099.1 hypothetical protein EDD42_0132 [Plantibacter flavus]SMG29305.1 hypothetical protein SAMN06295974_1995 [Plantibacter flavus]
MSRSDGRRGVVDIVVEGADLVITPRGWWGFLSLRRRIRVPSAAILSADVSADPTAEVPVRWRSGGTGTLMIRAGFFRGAGTRSWWCYRYGRSAVVIELELSRLQALVVMTDDDQATVEMLRRVNGAALSDH